MQYTEISLMLTTSNSNIQPKFIQKIQSVAQNVLSVSKSPTDTKTIVYSLKTPIKTKAAATFISAQ